MEMGFAIGLVADDRSIGTGFQYRRNSAVVELIVSALFEKFSWGVLTFAGVALLVVGNVFMLRAKRAA